MPRQPGCRLPRRSRAVLPDLGQDRWPSARVLPVKHHAQGPRELGHVLPPLLQLAESRVPLGDRLVALDLPGQARHREELQDSRETRDGMIEEFITELRKRLLPEDVAAEEAQMERLYPPVSDPLPGLDDGFPGPAGPEETTGQTL
jgi:hypothetical protein